MITTYSPLMATAIPSNRKQGQVVAFLGRQLVFFEADSRQPAVGETIPVMLTRPLYRLKAGSDFDYDSLMAIVVREVTDEFMYVEHAGFEYDPVTNTTLARCTSVDHPMWISPGRTAVWVLDPTRDVPAYKLQPRPGACFVRREDVENPDINAERHVVRCEGLVSWQDASYAAAVKE